MYDLTEHELQRSSERITYYNIFLKYSHVLKNNIYVAHIISYNPLTLANSFQIFRALKKTAELLMISDLSINKSNSLLFTIIEFKHGIKFIFDRRMFNKILKSKEEIENIFDLKLGGMVMVIDSKDNNKNIKEITQLAKFFKINFRVITTSSFDKALGIIKKIAKLS